MTLHTFPVTLRAAYACNIRSLHIETEPLDCLDVNILSYLSGHLSVEEKTTFFKMELATLVRQHLYIEMDSSQ